MRWAVSMKRGALASSPSTLRSSAMRTLRAASASWGIFVSVYVLDEVEAVMTERLGFATRLAASPLGRLAAWQGSPEGAPNEELFA